MTDLYYTIGLGIWMYMTVIYGFSVFFKDMSIVDIGWSLGFVGIAWYCLGATKGSVSLYTMTILVTVWGLRLADHIAARKIRTPGEDFRYAKWRKDWGKHVYWRSYLQVFLLQGVLMFCIALPIMATAQRTSAYIFFLTLGSCVWLGGFILESVADAQLQRFIQKKDNAGTLLTTGVWKYSRHPNYFGEAVQWWGIWLVALSVPGTWWTILSPILLTYLLRYVSGVPLLEKKFAKKPGFAKYAQETSIFVPLPPKKVTQ